ncbi:MAG: HAMP domain-containing histidine kinase [Bacteroidales bacterium]|nr:HAMP domain-containing histidine kinase [Bacteroidales bacterium]
MFRLFRTLIIAAVALSCFFSCNLKKDKKPIVVVMHSYSDAGQDGELFRKRMEYELKARNLDVDVRHFYFNMPYYSIDFLGDQAFGPCRDSILSWQPAAILVNDDPLFKWVMNYEGSLFHQFPIVYSGVTHIDTAKMRRYPNVTGFMDSLDLARNGEICRMVSGLNNPIIELDNYVGDVCLKKYCNENISDTTKYVNNKDFHVDILNKDTLALPKYSDKVIFTFFSALQPESNKSSGMPDIVGLHNVHDLYNQAKELAMIQVKFDLFSNSLIDRSGRPQFTAIREQFASQSQKRILGGYFSSTETQIADQVSYLARILNGEKPSDIPRGVHMKDYYMDWNAMESYVPPLRYEDWSDTFHISNAPLKVKNPKAYMVWMINSVFLIIVLIGSLVYFLIWIRMQSNAKLMEQLQKNALYRSLVFGNARAGIWKIDHGTIILQSDWGNKIGIANRPIPLEEMAKVVDPKTMDSYRFIVDFKKHPGYHKVRVRSSIDGFKTWIWWEIIFTVHEDNIKNDSVCGLIINCDKYKEEEDELVAALDKASEVSVKENFISNISHDIRTPLNAISGFSELLAMTECSSEDRAMYTDVIQDNTDQLLNMIDSVVDKSESETDGMAFKILPVSIAELVEKCYKTNGILCPSNIKFLEAKGERDVTVKCDQVRMKQVVNNFVGNAFKFTPNGSITIGWTVDEKAGTVEVFVEDTGIGIQADKVDSVFERFNKTTENDKGTGLGLNICKTIIEKQGGKIGVKSDFGKGSHFYFTMPYEKEEQA